MQLLYRFYFILAQSSYYHTAWYFFPHLHSFVLAFGRVSGSCKHAAAFSCCFARANLPCTNVNLYIYIYSRYIVSNTRIPFFHTCYLSHPLKLYSTPPPRAYIPSLGAPGNVCLHSYILPRAPSTDYWFGSSNATPPVQRTRRSNRFWKWRRRVFHVIIRGGTSDDSDVSPTLSPCNAATLYPTERRVTQARKRHAIPLVSYHACTINIVMMICLFFLFFIFLSSSFLFFLNHFRRTMN